MPNCNSNIIAFTRACENISSGVKNVWIASYDSSTTWSVDANGAITGATSATTFYKMEVREGTTTFNEEVIVNAQYGSRSVRQTAQMTIIGQGQTGRTFVNGLLGARMVVGLELEEGVFILLGDDKQLEVSQGSSNPGVQAGEANIIQFSVSGLANDFAPTVEDSFAATIFI